MIGKVLTGLRVDPKAQAKKRTLGSTLSSAYKLGSKTLSTLENPTGTIAEQLAKRKKKKISDATPQP